MATTKDTLRVLQILQSRGLAWMATVRSRDEVTRAMARHMAALGLRAGALPPVLHVAGTKGKGSTAAFAEAVLRAGGLRTGLFTSPHLVSPTERFRVDGEPLADAVYCAAFWRAWADVGGGDPAGAGARDALDVPAELPGFNFLTLLAFRLFIAARVDVVVLEVGVGGLLDATNVLPADRVLASAITQLCVRAFARARAARTISDETPPSLTPSAATTTTRTFSARRLRTLQRRRRAS